MEILVDYLTFSDTEHDYNFWMNFFGLFGVHFEAANSRYGWSEHQICNGVHIYLGQREDVCFEFSGKGCRFVEECNSCDFDWLSCFDFLIHSPGVHVSRLDIAGDDRDGILDFNKLYVSTRKHKYISRAKRCVWMDGAEQEILFGSSKSDTRLRIYNKALERGVDEHWIRCEFQFRDDAAESFIFNLLKKKMLAYAIPGCLLIIFVTLYSFQTRIIITQELIRLPGG